MRMRIVKVAILLAVAAHTASAVVAAGDPVGAKPASPAPAAAAPPAAPPPAPPPPVREAPGTAARRGLVDFERYCASCHGRDGDGLGPSARKFAARATNFTTGVYKCRSTAPGTLPTDDDLRRSIVHGLPGSGMPQFVALGPLQTDDLVAALKYFSPRFGRDAQGPALAVAPEPANDQQSVARGAQVYDRLKCANCHGWRGEGGPAAANLHNDDGTPAEVTDFLRKDALRCGDSPARLFTTLMGGLDGTPMASYAEAIEGGDAWDLVHYLLSLRR